MVENRFQPIQLGVLLTIFLCFSNPIHASTIFGLHSKSSMQEISLRDKLKLIPPSDYQKLERFFHTLFSQADFSLTLFGNKPMGSIDLIFEVGISNAPSPSVIGMNGWNIWKQYQHLFINSNYTIVHYNTIYENYFLVF